MLTHSGLTLWSLKGGEGEQKERGGQRMESKTKVRRETEVGEGRKSLQGEHQSCSFGQSTDSFPSPSSGETAVKAP